MKQPKILVTGATGKTGRAVVDELLAKGVPVRAVVRSKDAPSAALERAGAETVVADMFDPDQLLAAMRGTQRAYYLPIYDPYLIQSATAFAVAARNARLEAVVSLGKWLASATHPSLSTRQAWLMDQVFSMMPGVAHVRVNPGYFADNYLRLIGYAAHLGVFPIVTGNSEDAPPSNEDIARVVVAALMAPGKHAGKRYRPTGPALLSGDDMAHILSRVLGTKIRRVDLPWWMFRKAARLQNAGAFLMSGCGITSKITSKVHLLLARPRMMFWKSRAVPPRILRQPRGAMPPGQKPRGILETGCVPLLGSCALP